MRIRNGRLASASIAALMPVVIQDTISKIKRQKQGNKPANGVIGYMKENTSPWKNHERVKIKL